MPYQRLMLWLARHAGVRVFRLFTRRLAPAEPAAAPGAVLRLMSESAVLDQCGTSTLELSGDKVAAAYARGDLCAGAFERERLVGYCWLAFRDLPHLDGVWVAFAPHAVWTYKSFVLPSHRGRGIAAALYRFGDGVCAARGRHFSILCMESHNRASIAAARRAGYAGAGFTGYARRGARFAAWYSRRARANAVRFFLPSSAGSV